MMIVLSPLLLQGEELRFRVEPVISREGFSRTTVYSILQDHYGFLWFGTRNGLVRYDGYSTRTYLCGHTPQSNEITSCVIRTVAEDSAGFIWAGTQDGGVIRLDRRSGEIWNFRHDPRDSTSLGPGRVESILVDARGEIWIATEGTGPTAPDCMVRYQPRSGRFARYGTNPSGGFPAGGNLAPYIDRDGGLWVCSTLHGRRPDGGDSRGYLSRYDTATDRFTTRLTVLGIYAIRIIGENAAGKLALSGESAAYERSPMIRLFDPKGGMTLSLEIPMRKKLRDGERVFPIQYDDDGRCWYALAAATGPGVGPAGRALLYCDMLVPSGSTSSKTADPSSGPRPILTGGVGMLMTDRSGVKWAATEEGAVKISDIGSGFTTWRHDPNDSTTLSAPRIRSIWTDHTGLLWVGTDLGLNRYDRANDRWDRYFWHPGDRGSLPNSTVNTIYEDRRGALLFGTNGGLAAFDRSMDRFAPLRFSIADASSTHRIWSILNDRSGRTWIGTGSSGLFLVDIAGKTSRHFSTDTSDPAGISGRGVWCLREDHRGTIWIGTNDGLYRWLPQSGTFRRYAHRSGNPRSLGGDRIWDLYEDRAGGLWVTAYGGGISRYDPAGDDFTTIGTHNGLPSNRVFGVLEDDQGIFWISSIVGLVRWDRQSNEFRVYDRSDGLQGDEFAFKAICKAPDGTLYFGGTEGLTAFNPKTFRTNGLVPHIAITGFYLFDSLAAGELIDGDTIRLHYDQNFLSFDFASLDYVNPERNLFSYLLEGVDPAWVHVGSDHRIATYTDLAPGSYTFRVHGSNNDGVWNERGISITVIITPPWWATWWVRALALAAAMAIGVALVGLRINGIRRIEREKQQGAVQAALESQEAERRRIARELHDGIGQMIAAAGVNVSYASQLAKQQPGGAGSDIGASLDRSLSILDQVSVDLRAISHALGTISLQDIGLASALGELLASVAAHQRTRFELEAFGMDERLPEGIETGLFRIAQELITNVLRHADATEAIVQIVREDAEIRLTVEDNGVGFDISQASKGMGRRNIAARVSVMNGDLHYDVSPGHGTTVMVRVSMPVRPVPDPGSSST
jgi:signal transduction histidine kinase/ligand-binding sensor domain-containing protein